MIESTDIIAEMPVIK